MMTKIRAWIAISCFVIPFFGGAALAQAAQGPIVVASAEPEVVWGYSYPGTACAANDYPDVPVRPFMGNGPTPGTYRIHWFAGNSNGYFASEAPGNPVSANQVSLARIQRLPDCARWVESWPYANSTPENYYTGLWMVAPYTSDGVNVYALIHNEFHGEWTGQSEWCSTQTRSIYLPCDYWNIVAATSDDSGGHFSLIQQQSDQNTPAIALPAPYTPNYAPGPQGMTAQSNIFGQGGYAYILVEQFGTQLLKPADNGGVCLVRSQLPLGRASRWQAWANGQWVALPMVYPSNIPTTPPCSPILPNTLSNRFRFSWSYNVILSHFILIGLETDNSHVVTSSCPAANSSVGNSKEAFVYIIVKADLAKGQFKVVTPETCLLRINWFNQSGPNDPANTGEAYPSLLDPSSPILQPGGRIDLNFQYSGSAPYLYAVRLDPYSQTNTHYYDRDVVRWKLSISPLGPAKTR